MAETLDVREAQRDPADGNPLDQLEAYELRNLVSHLVEAGRLSDLDRLLRLETAVGRNAWHEARERAGDSAGFVTDVVAALAAVQAQHSDPDGIDVAKALAIEYRYSLLLVSIHSLTGRVGPALLAALAGSGLWSPSETATYARRGPDPEQRMTALARLVPLAEEPERTALGREVLEAVDEELHPLAKSSGGWTPLHDRYLSAADAIARMVPSLAVQARSEALEKILAITSWALSETNVFVFGRFAERLEQIGPFLSSQQQEHLLRKGLESDPEVRLWLLRALASSVTGSLAEDLRDAAAEFAVASRAEILLRVAANLPPHEREKALADALEAAKESQSPHILAQALRFVDGSEAADVLARAVKAIDGYAGGVARAIQLLRVCQSAEHVVSHSHLVRAVEEARWGLLERERLSPGQIALLADLGAKLPSDLREKLLQDILKAAHRFNDPPDRMEALAAVARGLEEPERTTVLSEAFHSLRREAAIPPDDQELVLRGPTGRLDRMRAALEHLAPSLPPALLREALAFSRVVGDEQWSLEALAALAPYRSHGPGDGALAAARAAIDVFEATGSLNTLRDKVELLREFAHRSSGRARLELLAEGLERAVGGIGSEAEECVTRVGTLLADEEGPDALRVWERALRSTLNRNVAWGGRVLAALFRAEPRGAGTGWRWRRKRTRLLNETLDATRRLRQGSGRAEALIALVPQLPEGKRAALLQEAVQAVQASFEEARREVQSPVDPHVDRNFADSLQRIAREIAEAASAVAASLPESQGRRLLAEAEAVVHAVSARLDRPDARALVALAHRARPGDRRRLLDPALVAARRSSSDAGQLAVIAPLVDGPLRREVLAEAVGRARGSGTSFHRDPVNNAEISRIWTDLRRGLEILSPVDLLRVLSTPPTTLAGLDRGSICFEIRYLGPLLAGVGGSMLVEALTDAIEDVRRWWP